MSWRGRVDVTGEFTKSSFMDECVGA
jgi:hypothetical protein